MEGYRNHENRRYYAPIQSTLKVTLEKDENEGCYSAENEDKLWIYMPPDCDQRVVGAPTIVGGYLFRCGLIRKLLRHKIGELVMGIDKISFSSPIPHEKRGRVFGVLSTLTTALMPISYAWIGSISTVLSNIVIFLLLGLMVIALSLLLYAVPGIKEV